MAKSPRKGNGKSIPRVDINLDLSPKRGEELIAILRERFEQNMNRHKSLDWTKLQKILIAQPKKLSSLFAMENTGGEPDVIGYDKTTEEYIFCDCSSESPNRRSICYDREGEAKREKKGIFPGGNAVDLAAAMGIELLNENQYRNLQKLGNFDTKTSSWVSTPPEIRELGGALFMDRRYDTVFVFHNGANSFYSSRGFRGSLRVK